MTNGDRIRNMSNEELAEMLKKTETCYWCNYYVNGENCRDVPCIEGIKAYLDMEVAEWQD